MKRHTNIEINRFTNFLKEGAFVRRQGIWTLLFNTKDRPANAAFCSVKADYLTAVASRKHYENQWDMSNDEFVGALNSLLSSAIGDREKIIIDWSVIDKKPFQKAFDLTQMAISMGEVKKVVPFACQTGKLRQPITSVQKLTLLKRMSETPESLYPYGEWDEASGFMGASPELFFELNNNDLRTMALAGTAGKDVPVEVFINDPKERKEHQYVIDDIVEQLSIISDVAVAETRVVQFPSLNHLETKISAKLFARTSVDELIKRLHPTPALGIYPRGSYFQKFAQFPYQAERGLFGAPWGLETEGHVFLLVAIRKWDWVGKDVKIYAGCGVVKESVLEKEFAEILKKIDSVKRLFFREEVE